MYLNRAILGLVCAGLLFAIAPPPAFSADAAIRPERTIRLFKGKDLSQFNTWSKVSRYEDPRQVFTVQDGLIRISGEDFGAITTKREYRDYRLVVEWKWGQRIFPPRIGKARDSGVLVHAVGEDGAYSGIWMQSIEAQIIEGGTGDFILVNGASKPSLTVEARIGKDGQHYWQKGQQQITKDTGRFNWYARAPERKDVSDFRGREDLDKPVGEWNRLEVICDGDTITNIVNGVVANQGTHASQQSGKIQIQSEGAEILIRTVELHPLAQARDRR